MLDTSVNVLQSVQDERQRCSYGFQMSAGLLRTPPLFPKVCAEILFMSYCSTLIRSLRLGVLDQSTNYELNFPKYSMSAVTTNLRLITKSAGSSFA